MLQAQLAEKPRASHSVSCGALLCHICSMLGSPGWAKDHTDKMKLNGQAASGGGISAESHTTLLRCVSSPSLVSSPQRSSILAFMDVNGFDVEADFRVAFQITKCYLGFPARN